VLADFSQRDGFAEAGDVLVGVLVFSLIRPFGPPSPSGRRVYRALSFWERVGVRVQGVIDFLLYRFCIL
jgi:hypothetical protein